MFQLIFGVSVTGNRGVKSTLSVWHTPTVLEQPHAKIQGRTHQRLL